jgi:hypothetical protein
VKIEMTDVEEVDMALSSITYREMFEGV